MLYASPKKLELLLWSIIKKGHFLKAQNIFAFSVLNIDCVHNLLFKNNQYLINKYT